MNPETVSQELATHPDADDSLFLHNHTILTWQVSHVAFAVSRKSATHTPEQFLARVIVTGIGGQSHRVGQQTWPDRIHLPDWGKELSVSEATSESIASEMDRARHDLLEAEELGGEIPEWFTIPSVVIRAWHVVELKTTCRHFYGPDTYVIETSDHFCFLEINWES